MSKQTTGRTLFKGGTIVTMDPKVPNLSMGDVLVEGGRIAAVGVNLQVDDAVVIDASDSIVMPGFIDAHHHMWRGVMRRMMPDVDDLFAYIDVVAEKLGAHYRPLDMYLSTKLTALASLDAGVTTIIDACHSSRSPGHTDAALDALDDAGIRALHMVGAAMDKKASAAHLPADLKRLADNWNHGDGLVRVGLFGQLNLDWWKVARGLDMRILTEFIGDLAKIGPEFAEKGVLGSHNIFNHCTRVPQATWKLFADAGVNVTVNPRSDALFGFDDESFAYQQAIDHGLTPALGIDLDTAFGSDLFGEMHGLFGQQRSAMRYRRCRSRKRDRYADARQAGRHHHGPHQWRRRVPGDECHRHDRAGGRALRCRHGDGCRRGPQACRQVGWRRCRQAHGRCDRFARPSARGERLSPEPVRHIHRREGRSLTRHRRPKSGRRYHFLNRIAWRQSCQ